MTSTIEPTATPGRVLFVCTGNLCRSPMAAGLARASLGENRGVTFRSAGFVRAGKPATREAVQVMAELGIDISQHRSSLVKDVIGSMPDLILCMTGQHLRSTVEIAPGVLSRTFTLAEIVELAAKQIERPTHESLSEFLSRVSYTRNMLQLAKANIPGDIADPIGQPIAVYRRCASELKRMIDISSTFLWPTEDRTSPASS